MTFFNLEIDPKDVASAKFISETQRGLVKEIIDARLQDKSITRSELARKINMDKGSLTKILNGSGNITLRKLGEIAWALDLEPVVVYQKVGVERHNSRSNYKSSKVEAHLSSLRWSGDDGKEKARYTGKVVKTSAGPLNAA